MSVDCHHPALKLNKSHYLPAIMAAITGNFAPISVVWIFIVAPLVGGALAAVVYKGLEKSKAAPAEK